jgi:hypothetical protein
MPYADREQQRQYQRERSRRLRAEWLAANGPCRKCESWDDLQVDHVDPATKVSHRIWSWAPARREAELKKCQPLCRDCHEAKCEEEMRRPLVHGTVSGYRHRGCRCADCCAANTAQSRAWKAASSRGGTRTLDLSIMSRTLSPAELLCQDFQPLTSADTSKPATSQLTARCQKC